MKILLLAAMDKEVSLLRNILTNVSSSKIEFGEVFVGNIGAHMVVIAKCGIGKVNAALNCLRLLEEFKPDLVINSGVAGGVYVPVGTILIADKIAYNDVWCGPGTRFGQADGLPLYMKPEEKLLELARQNIDNVMFGLITTGDEFIATKEKVKEIIDHFPEVKAVDMESAAIAQTCILSSIPFAIIRIVSDTPGEADNVSQYENFWKEAPEKTFNVLKLLLSKL